MKLPVLESKNTRMNAQQMYAGGTYASPAAGIAPNNIFGDILGGIGDIVKGGIGKIPCILSKAGPKGIECFTQCGPNLGCLAACAGPTLANSVLACL